MLSSKPIVLCASVVVAFTLGACGTATSPSSASAPTSAPAATMAAPTSAPAATMAASTSVPAATAEPASMTESSAGAVALGEQTQAVVSAALEYMRGQLGVTADDLLRVEVQGIEGDFARVIVVPATSMELDPSTVFLKRSGDSWQGVSNGTAFAPEDMQALGIPEHLQTLDSGDMFDPEHDAVPVGDYLLGVTTDEVVSAAGAAAREATGLPADAPLAVDIVGIDGDFGRAFVVPESQDVDSTTVFLKRNGEEWGSVLTGSAFMGDELTELGIPATLWREGE